MKPSTQEIIKQAAESLSAFGVEHRVISDEEDAEMQIIQAGFDINLKTEDGEVFETRFPLTIMLIRDAFDDLYVRLTITPFIEKETPELPTNIYKELAELNNRIPILKFAVDGDNDLELIADLTAGDVDRGAIEATLSLMADYINVCFPYLLSVLKPEPVGEA